ncbi:patatin-like phospholipase family protein [Pikeienuella sp. HZG-20]|uniref:patatin-like phospholipase family protein n=1 Tax=Paludibacillus litoralis TaxID=3133267 RepID=UPI0030ED595E
MRPCSYRRRSLVLALAVLLSACAPSLVRNPAPEAMLGQAHPLGVPGLRSWGDALSPEDVDAFVERRGAIMKAAYGPEIAAGRTPTLNYLALSGGGQWGAFGAGVLRAWSDSGARPVFAGVSGISTGAIIAPFAFLGPKYDHVLEEIYTGYSTEDLIEPTIFSGLVSGASLADTSKLEAIIAEKVTPALLAEVAEEHRKGRFLLVGTTNLDAGRPMIWNMGAIAASGLPGAPHLFRQLILASASIPVAFPPAIIKVVAPDGRVYDELHVDGGATSQVTFVAPDVPIRDVTVAALGRNLDRRLYLIMNNDLAPPYAPVRPRIGDIGGAAVSALIRGSGTGDLYKIYLIAERDEIAFKAGWIPAELPCSDPQEAFDKVFMSCLYKVGADLFRSGELWRDLPPNFVLEP